MTAETGSWPAAKKRWSWLQRAWRRLTVWQKRLTAGGAGAVIAAAFAAYHYVVPNLEIKAGTVGSDIDARAAEFNIKNAGNIPLVNADITCEISASNGRFESGLNLFMGAGRDESQIVELKPNETATRNCAKLLGEMFGHPPALYPATITIGVTSRWAYWPHFSVKAEQTFVGIRNATGHIEIQPDSK